LASFFTVIGLVMSGLILIILLVVAFLLWLLFDMDEDEI